MSGEVPGLDCGYCGILFTSEYNAIVKLNYPNFHQSQGQYQQENTACIIFTIREKTAETLGLDIIQFSEQLFSPTPVLHSLKGE